MRELKSDADVIVIGGGHAGLTMSLLLARAGISVICIDRDPPAKTLAKDYDPRTTAISYGSAQVLGHAGVWEALLPDACPIEDIKITESGAPTLLTFLVEDVDAPAFGWILDNRDLRAAMYEALAKYKTAKHITGAKVEAIEQGDTAHRVHLEDGQVFSASLIIGADGRGSFTREAFHIGVREWSYHQQAVIACITHEKPHHNMALEDFREEGPFAVLPMVDDAKGQHRSALVWTEETRRKSKSLLEYDDAPFTEALAAHLPDSYGRVLSVSARRAYPLGLIHAHSYTAHRMALVADAAHGIHPIAGQGLNLGLRDVACLAEKLARAHEAGLDLGDETLLQSYEAERRPDNMLMAGVTDGLNKLFSKRLPLLSPLRKAGLKLVERAPATKKFFMRQAMGTAGFVPDLLKKKKA